MPTHVIRFQTIEGAQGADVHWGVLKDAEVAVIPGEFATTKDFLQRGKDTAHRIASADTWQPDFTIDQIRCVSPVTKPCQVLCQGANYRTHMKESGLNPDDKKFNMFFHKSCASIAGPFDTIERPAHVRLLDYEVELGIVIGRDITKRCEINDDTIGLYVAGLVIGNDISARDVQVPQMQFFKGKSYRTFCPVGPVLCLLETHELHYLHDMMLTLRVNGEIRQQDSTRNLVYKPAETLSELSQVSNLYVGDLVMTGTPAGCAMRVPPPAITRLSGLLPEQVKWNLFKKMQSKRSEYLQPGDLVETTISSADGVIQLGKQENRVA